MNPRYFKNAARIALFFFWSISCLYTLPSRFASNHNLSCACHPSACECSRVSPCHEKGHSKSNSDPVLVSASCQSGRKAVEVRYNFEVYPVGFFSFLGDRKLSTTVLLRDPHQPATFFSDPLFKPPKLS
jgi:hypothetical protein